MHAPRPPAPPAGGPELPRSEVMTLELPDLLEQDFARGGRQSLHAAFERHGALVHSFCRRVVGADDAADVTQEVFLSAWRAQERYDPMRGGLAGWLVGIARNRSIDHLRRRSRQHAAEGAVVTVGATDSDIDGIAERMILADALEELPPRQRAILRLAFFEDLTHSQIAERCNLPLGTVKSDLHRQLPRLVEALGDLGSRDDTHG